VSQTIKSIKQQVLAASIAKVMMDEIRKYETSVNLYEITRRNNPEDRNPRSCLLVFETTFKPGTLAQKAAVLFTEPRRSMNRRITYTCALTILQGTKITKSTELCAKKYLISLM
jgi:hypothetical protein